MNSNFDLTSLGAVLESDFLLIGELHGSRQNAPLILEIANQLLERTQSLTIAFEWSLQEEELLMLQRFIKGGKKPDSLSSFFTDSDGRFTYEHIELLNWIRDINLNSENCIEIVIFDVTTSSEDYERLMAERLIDYKSTSKSLFLVETGSVHARKKIFEFDEKEINPLGSILSEHSKVYSVFLNYIEGAVTVEDEIYNVRDSYTLQEGPCDYFDYVIDIPHSDPAPNLENLTEIYNLLK